MEEQNIGKGMADCFDKIIETIMPHKSPIANRLEASLNYDVINGDSFERSVLSSQIQEAIGELRRMNRPITEHPDVQRLIGQVVELQANNNELTNDLDLHDIIVDTYKARIKFLEESLDRILPYTDTPEEIDEIKKQALKGE